MTQQNYFNNSITGKWIDLLGSALASEAKAAGIFDHNVSTGTVRENVLAAILRRIIPPVCEIGSGQILFHEDKLSPQCDIIVYDGRCPRYLSEAGLGVYPADGVIAAIEVKSSLGKSSLRKALVQCAGFHPPSSNMDIARTLYSSGKVSNTKRLECHTPRVYLFAYQNTLSPESAAQCVKEYLCVDQEYDPLRWTSLPVCISSDNIAGLMASSDIQFSFNDLDMRDLKESYGDCSPFYMWCAHDQGFGQFIAHVAYQATMRVASFDIRTGLRGAPETTLPLNYFSGNFENKEQFVLFCKNASVSSWSERIVEVEHKRNT